MCFPFLLDESGFPLQELFHSTNTVRRDLDLAVRHVSLFSNGACPESRNLDASGHYSRSVGATILVNLGRPEEMDILEI